jgi:DNA polymerase-3 subunit gamma/tau
MATLLQQVALSQVVPAALDAQDPQTADALRLTTMMAADEVQLAYSIVLHGRAEIALAPDEYSGLVMVLLRWLAFPPTAEAPRAEAPPDLARAAPSPAASQTVARPPGGGRDEPPPWATASIDEGIDIAPVAKRGAETVAAPVSLVPTQLGDRWERHVRALIEQGSVSAMARELALQAQCVAIDGATWRLRVERDSLRAPAQRDRLQAALRQLLGEPVELTIELGATDDTPGRRETAAREQRQRQAERVIEQDPLVQALMQQYRGARIVPGSVKPH